MVELTNLIASWVAHHCQISPSYDLATVIPCHWRRRLTRGFDHIWLLAHALAKTGLIEPPTKTLKHSKPLPFLHLQVSLIVTLILITFAPFAQSRAKGY